MTPSFPQFLQPWLGSRPLAAVLLYGGLALAVLTAVIILWVVFGRGPRRKRSFYKAQRLLQQGEWQKALSQVQHLHKLGRPPAAWQGRLVNLEGECHRSAGDAALREKSCEEAMRHYQQAAGLLHVDEAEWRNRVIETMLAEVRRLIAANAGHSETYQLIERIGHVRAPCPEVALLARHLPGP